MKKTVPVPVKRSVAVPKKPVTKNAEESKVANGDLHYCTVGPKTNYFELLDAKGFEFSGEELKLKVKGVEGPLPKMNQQEFEELGDVVMGWIR